MLSPDDLSIWVPSRSRAPQAAALLRGPLPTATIVVAENEYDTYVQQGVAPAHLTTHPNLFGLSRIRNWIVRHSPTLVTVQVDDDFRCFHGMTGRRPRIITDPESILMVLYSTAVVAQEAGAHLFGYGDALRPLYYKPDRPFTLTEVVDQVIGVIGKEVLWDDRLIMKGDTDATLRELLVRRIVWVDNRLAPNCGQMFQNKGGLQDIRTNRLREADIRLIEDKWGAAVECRKRNKSGSSVNRIMVKR